MVNNRTETRHFRCNLLLDYINLFFTFLKIDILLSCVLSQMFIFNEYLMPFYLTSTIYKLDVWYNAKKAYKNMQAFCCYVCSSFL